MTLKRLTQQQINSHTDAPDFYPRVGNNANIVFTENVNALLQKGLKYNVHFKPKQWILSPQYYIQFSFQRLKYLLLVYLLCPHISQTFFHSLYTFRNLFDQLFQSFLILLSNCFLPFLGLSPNLFPFYLFFLHRFPHHV
jgi:hypothetical protein